MFFLKPQIPCFLLPCEAPPITFSTGDSPTWFQLLQKVLYLFWKKLQILLLRAFPVGCVAWAFSCLHSPGGAAVSGGLHRCPPTQPPGEGGPWQDGAPEEAMTAVCLQRWAPASCPPALGSGTRESRALCWTLFCFRRERKRERLY